MVIHLCWMQTWGDSEFSVLWLSLWPLQGQEHPEQKNCKLSLKFKQPELSFWKASVDYSEALTLNPPHSASTGQCISRFTNRKVPYCVKFNPDEDKQNLFVAGMSDKKIVQVKLAFAEIWAVQFSSRHHLRYFPVDQADALVTFFVYPLCPQQHEIHYRLNSCCPQM